MARNRNRTGNDAGENDAFDTGGDDADEGEQDTGEPAEQSAPAVPLTTRVVVAQRRSLMVPHKVGVRLVNGKEVDLMGHRVAGPGEQVEVHTAEVAHLTARGFIEPGHMPANLDSEPPNVAPGAVTVNGRDGNVIEVDRE